MDKIKLFILFVVGTFICSCGDEKPSATGPKRPEYTPKFGTVFDERDGRTYKTTVINGLEWMAENLNYVVDSSFCYNDESAYCEKYGRLYRWESAMALDTTAIRVRQWTEGKKYQGVCPQGWHLPTLEELRTLNHFIYEWMRAEDLSFQKKIGFTEWYYLKSKEGWQGTIPEDDDTRDDYSLKSVLTSNGDDFFGFSLKPAGWWGLGVYRNEGACAAFWLSDEGEYNDGDAYMANCFCYDNFYFIQFWKVNRASVRCVKN